MNLRTFIALEVPETHKQAILGYLSSWSRLHKNGINWVKPENLHLTMLFIGDTQSGDIPQLQEALFNLIIKRAGFRMKCLGFELFPAREPRLIWAKLDTADKEVYSFAKDLNRTVRELGYEPDIKPLKLHITVGRIKVQQPVWLEQEIMQSALLSEPAVYDEITLYQSMLKPDGPVYTPLQQYRMIKRNQEKILED
jgi:RNA 2',3'-cyclic 3'-phosphodiesterase